jgi:hypothetical protein
MLGDGMEAVTDWSTTLMSVLSGLTVLCLHGRVHGFMPTLIVNSFCHHQVKARDEGRGARDELQKEMDGV